jgi:hypothetical protein
MSHQTLRRRIRKIENLLAKAEEVISNEQKKRAARDEVFDELMRDFARHHATAVAAIIMFGNPQIDEPLVDAWRRAHRSLGILNEYEDEYSFRNKLADGNDGNGMNSYYEDWEYTNACEQLYPIIINDANESEKFAEIFARAPIWLLNFTNMALDGFFLKFSLPPTCKIWLSQGMWKFWPYIPFGTATNGDLGTEIASEERGASEEG